MTTPAEFVEQNQDLLLQTLKEMTCIPAPSRASTGARATAWTA